MILYKFVLVNTVPKSTEEAANLSNSMTLDHGKNGWRLVSSTIVPTNGSPGLLLSFQKEMPDDPSLTRALTEVRR